VLARFFSKPFFLAVLLWGAIGAGLYLLLDSVVLPYLAGKFKGTVKVPVLVSLPPEQAKSLLDKDRLIYMLDSSGDYSTDVPAGRILTQYPEAGTVVKQGRRVWIRISKGAKSVELPALRGLSLRQAEITLQQLGLKVGRVREVRSGSIPAGAVIGTSPGKGATLEKGREVNVELSLGTDAAPPGMPNLVGMSLARAKERLRELGLKPGKVAYKKDGRQLPGTVLAQTPAAGAEYKARNVDMVISK
jgi:serine/threonine-protein kinase